MSKNTGSFIKSIFKVLGHGFVILLGYIFFGIYMDISMMYYFIHVGNYIFFIPLLLVLFIPLVIIILGALNSYSVRYIYHRKTDESWYNLLIEGIFVLFIGFVFTVAFSILIIYFFGQHWPPFYLNFGLLFVIFYLLLIPSMGYSTKEMTLALFTRSIDTKKQSEIEESQHESEK